MRCFRKDRSALKKHMPRFLSFVNSIRDRHPAICDCNFTNWMWRANDGMMVWSDPIAHLTETETLDFIEEYGFSPSKQMTL